MKPHLLLIDALNLIRRIYAVDVNQKHHSDEQMIQTCSARVAHACKKLLNTTNATHAIAVFDGDIPVAIDAQIYTNNKANWCQLQIDLPVFLEGR